MCLDRGYTVHTTVRSAEKAAFLQKIDGAEERLKIFDGVDLLAPGAFDEAITGCEAVLHTASPFFTQGGTEDTLVKPAVMGTRTVLASCTKAGVKKVVLTSSVASILFTDMPPETVYTGEIWSNEEMMRSMSQWYYLSKTVAERTAWEMSKEDGCPWTLSAINPTYVYGPMLPGQPSLNTSSKMIVEFFDGGMTQIDNDYQQLVDVRDVAEAHVNALEKEDAFGKRFLLIGEVRHRREFAQIVRDNVPEDLKKNVPSEVKKSEKEPTPLLFDAAPAENILGLKLRGLEGSIPETVQQLLENGFTSTSQYTPGK